MVEWWKNGRPNTGILERKIEKRNDGTKIETKE